MTRNEAIKRLERYHNNIRNCDYLPELNEALVIALKDMRDAENNKKPEPRKGGSTALFRFMEEEYV